MKLSIVLTVLLIISLMGFLKPVNGQKVITGNNNIKLKDCSKYSICTLLSKLSYIYVQVQVRIKKV